MEKEHKKLSYLVNQWNESRLDLFRISEPNEKLEFHGVIRFYSQDSSNNGKYATKCVRVSSTASTTDVIVTLAEKFRSDMRMLTKPKYGLYEVHVDGETRKLQGDEKPLVVQLGWVKDDREGRFLLRNEDKKGPVYGLYEESEDTIKGFKLTRNLTKREKKQQRKNKKQNNAIKKTTEEDSTTSSSEFSAVKHLYNQVPESTFTRTVSNPEAVMKKRREQKMQKRGGKSDIVKIYGDSLNPEIPYKSLLLLPSDKTEVVVRDALDKYGLEKEATSDYNVIKVASNAFRFTKASNPTSYYPIISTQIILPPGSKPEECFEGGWGREVALTRDDYIPSTDIVKGKTIHLKQNSQTSCYITSNISVVKPKFILTARDNWIIHRISPNVTEIGCNHENAKYGQFIQLHPSPELFPCHCVITNMDGVVTVTPHEGSGKVLVNGKMISETKMLAHEDIVNLGRRTMLVFCDPGLDIPVSGAGMSRTCYMEKRKSAMEQYRPTPDQQQGRPRNKSYSQSESMYSPRQEPVALPASIAVMRGGKPLVYDLFIEIKLVKISKLEGKQFLSNIFSMDGNTLHFKLSPSYTSYMFIRSLVPHFNEVVSYLSLITELLDQSIQLSASSVTELAFWMANSEILNFMRQDVELSPITVAAQDKFAKSVQLAFRLVCKVVQSILFDNRNTVIDSQCVSGHGLIYDILHMLSSAMTLLRRCRVNAALTIQLFSQLFHSINMWLFNRLVGNDQDARGLCCREWGIRIRTRLAMIETWAEKQGLELAADCHLARITQATHLLQAPKHSADDIAAISGTCFKLNSLQLEALLRNYQPQLHEGEKQISQQLIEKVVSVAQHSADELTKSDGRDISLKEDPDLQLPFLLPEDGYSCDVLRGVPSGLTEFINNSLRYEGKWDFSISPDASGSWTVHFTHALHPAEPVSHFCNNSSFKHKKRVLIPIIICPPQSNNSITFFPSMALTTFFLTVKLNKRSGGMGLSIVAARGSTEHQLGIYIRSVVKDGAADLDGRIQAGDQLISVDNKSLVGVDQSKAASLMVDTGPTITLRVAKQGAIYHGLA
uniref:Afadin n=1 Tax=Ciona savignyi TaxID=51511 RepID=H2ZJQ2_CIOSA